MTPAAPDARPRQLARIRALWPDRCLREVRMFGVIAVMVDDDMAVAVHQDGSLLVRVDPAEDGDLIRRPHAARAQMGTGRSMGAGWIRVDASGVCSEVELGSWLRAAGSYLDRRHPTRSGADRQE